MKNLIIKFISLFQRIVNFFYFNFFANIKTSIKLNKIQSLRLNTNLISDKIIWVSGMDKSGTTLLKNMLDKHPNIVCKSSGQFYNYYDDKTNWFQVKGGYDIIKKNIIESNWFKLHGKIWLNEDSIDNFIKILINDSFKSNISKDVKYISDKSVTQNFEKIKTNFPNSKYIAIIRDGRDVAVSLAFHYERNNKNSKFNKNKLLKDEFIKDHAIAWSSYARHLMNQKYVLIVKYEDILLDKSKILKQIFDYINIEYEEKTLLDICRHTSFQKMSTGRKPGQMDSKSFFRKGIAGDFENYFSKEKIQLYNSLSEDVLKYWNYIK